MSVSRFAIACGLLVCVAFAVRLGLAAKFVGLNSPPDGGANPDQLDYELFAWRLATGEGYTLPNGKPTARRMPGTSFVLLPVYLLFGHHYAAGRIWFCFLSALTCGATAWTGRILRDAPTGLMAGMFLAFYPNHAYYGMHYLSEVPSGLFTMLATGASILAFQERAAKPWGWIAGLCWGLSAMMRPNILLALPLLGLIVLLPSLRRGTWFGAVRTLIVIGLASAAVLAPWVARNRAVMGITGLSTVNALTFWGAHNHRILEVDPGGWIPSSELEDEQHPLSREELVRAAQAWTYSRQFLNEHAADLPYLTAMKLVKFFSPFMETENRIVRWVFAAGWVVAAILLVPGIWIVFRENRTAAFIATTPLLAMLATTVMYYGSIRFRDSVSPNYLLFGAAAVAYLITPKQTTESLPSTGL